VTNARGAVLNVIPNAMTSPVTRFSVDPMPIDLPPGTVPRNKW
jgi:hypothetical protein